MVYTINGTVIFDSVEHTIVPCQPGSGKECKLNQPASRCLSLLIENNGKTISQETFIEEVWRKKGMLVAVNTFYQNISILRKALISSGLKEKVVITVPKKGIMLHAEIEEQPQDSDTTPTIEKESRSEEKPKVKRGYFKIKTTYIFITALIILLINSAVFFFFMNKDALLHYPDYRYQTQYNGCRIYTNTKQSLHEIKEIESLDDALDCQNYAFVYLMLYTFSRQPSLIMCTNELSTAGTKSCYIKFIREVD